MLITPVSYQGRRPRYVADANRGIAGFTRFTVCVVSFICERAGVNQRLPEIELCGDKTRS